MEVSLSKIQLHNVSATNIKKNYRYMIFIMLAFLSASLDDITFIVM